MKYPFFSQSERDKDSTWSATARLYNLYREVTGQKVVLRSVLGMRRFGSIGATFCRAMAEIGGALYVSQGGGFYRVASNGVETLLANTDDAVKTTISGNNGDVTLCTDGKYYVWDGSAMSQPTGGAFSSFGSVEFINQYTVLTEKNGRRVQWTSAADATSLNALDFATAEGQDDDIIRAMAVGSVLWVMKVKSVEFWSTDGLGGLSALPGSTKSTGLKAFGLACKFPDGAFFVGNDNVVYVGSGNSFTPISSPAVSTSIEDEEPEACFYYQDQNHKMCVITFKSRPAWCFDISTGEWHERGEGVVGRWSVKAAAICYGKSFVGTDHGTIYELARDGRDNGNPLIRQATGTTIDVGGSRRGLVVSFFELPCSVGTIELNTIYQPEDTLLSDNDPGDGSVVGSAGAAIVVKRADTGREEQIELELSRDKGHTWGDPKPRGLGMVGEYDRAVIWRALGQFRHMTARVTYSGPFDVTIGTEADIEAA